MGVHYGKADFITYGKPSLFLDFANKKSLTDRISGNNLITFTRTSTGTYVDEDGLIKTAPANSPRFDHDPVTGECLGLLIEEQRTNLCFYGTTIENFAARSGGIKTANATTAPDGTVTATRLQGGGTTSPYFDDDSNKQYVAGRTYTFSCFFKANGTDEVYILIYGTNWNGSGGTNVVGHFDLTTGDIIAAAAGAEREPTGGVKMEPYPNGWYRCSITETCAITHNANHQFIRPPGGNADIYAWGYQIEESSFPTSYIPTTASSTVTRTPDNASITGTNFSSWYNPTEWTLMIAARRNYSGNFLTYPNLARINDGTTNNNIGFYGALGSTQFTNYGVNSGGANQTPYVAINVPTTSQFKMIQALKENDSTFGGNGTLTTTDTSVLMPVGVNQLLIGGDGKWGGTISQLTYYPVRLSNSQLQTLTK